MSFMKWGSWVWGPVSAPGSKLCTTARKTRAADVSPASDVFLQEIQRPLFSSDISLKSLQTGLAVMEVTLAVSVGYVVEML